MCTVLHTRYTRTARESTHIHRTCSSIYVSGGAPTYNRSDTIIFILSSGVSKILCVRSPWVIFRVVYLLYIYHGLLLLLCHYTVPNVSIYKAIIFQFDPIQLPLCIQNINIANSMHSQLADKKRGKYYSDVAILLLLLHAVTTHQRYKHVYKS